MEETVMLLSLIFYLLIFLAKEVTQILITTDGFVNTTNKKLQAFLIIQSLSSRLLYIMKTLSGRLEFTASLVVLFSIFTE